MMRDEEFELFLSELRRVRPDLFQRRFAAGGQIAIGAHMSSDGHERAGPGKGTMCNRLFFTKTLILA